MNLAKSLKQLLVLGILITLLTACSNGSSNRTATSESSTLPFGAEGITTETDYDGDGNWDTRAIYSFVYNDELQVTEVTIFYEDDDDADGIADYRTIETYVYDPTITAEEIMMKAAVQKDVGPSNNNGYGALLSRASVRYDYNETSGQVAENPYYSREYTYSYTADGKLLIYSYTRSYFNDEDGSLTGSFSAATTYVYDADGNIISSSHTSNSDDNGDGTQDSSESDVCTMSYDSNGYITNQSCVSTDDNDGDGPIEATQNNSETTYTHTYTDGMLTQTVVEDSDEETYIVDFTYNDDGLVATKTKSYENYVYRLAFTYDTEGRVVSYTYRYENDFDGDDVLNSFNEYFYTFSYDASGRITESSRQYRYDETPASPEYDDNYSYVHTYSYTVDGLVSSYGVMHKTDLDLDGELDNIAETSSYEHSYENGSIISLTYDYENTGSDDVIDYESHQTRLYTYQDGLLKSMVMEVDSDDDDVTDSASTIDVTYDASGQMTDYEANYYNDNYASLVRNEAVALTYNADDTVAGAIIYTTYSEGDSNITTIPLNIDFSTNGVPSGGMDYVLDTIEPDYCVTPSPATFLYYGSNYIEEQSYSINIKIPKILGIMWMISQGDD